MPSLSWKIAMVIALFLIMRLVVRPLAHIYAVNFGAVGGVIACALMLVAASVIERRGSPSRSIDTAAARELDAEIFQGGFFDA